MATTSIIWQNHTDGERLYRATSPNGNLSLDGGTSQATEGVRLYKFRNGNYEYWVWDGTLDNPESGTLEVYRTQKKASATRFPEKGMFHATHYLIAPAGKKTEVCLEKSKEPG